MSFRGGARLDPSQVEDVRGRGYGGPILVGGGGLGVLLLIAALLGINPLADYAGSPPRSTTHPRLRIARPAPTRTGAPTAARSGSSTASRSFGPTSSRGAERPIGQRGRSCSATPLRRPAGRRPRRWARFIA